MHIFIQNKIRYYKLFYFFTFNDNVFLIFEKKNVVFHLWGMFYLFGEVFLADTTFFKFGKTLGENFVFAFFPKEYRF
jgi:hypothetical protein